MMKSMVEFKVKFLLGPLLFEKSMVKFLGDTGSGLVMLTVLVTENYLRLV